LCGKYQQDHNPVLFSKKTGFSNEGANLACRSKTYKSNVGLPCPIEIKRFALPNKKIKIISKLVCPH
jgi:hypothetical protein